MVMTPNDVEPQSAVAALPASPPNKLLTATGLFLAIGVPGLAISRAWSMPFLSDWNAAFMLTATPFLVLLWVLLIEHRPLSGIGIRRLTWRTIGFGVAGIVVNVAISALGRQLFGPETQSAAMTRLLSGPGWLVVVVVTSGALLTEIALRGYAIERISELAGRKPWFGAIVQMIVTTALFIQSRGFAHGMIWLMDDAVFSLFYIRQRDTGACLIAHAMPNFVAATLVATGIAT